MSITERPLLLDRTRTAPRPSNWPRDWRWRSALALAFAIPYILLAAAVYDHGFSDSANAKLDARSQLIHWGASDLSFVGHVYPPLPTAVASLLPNAMSLGILGALAAGGILEALAFRLGSRGYPVWATLLVVAGVAASPSFAMTATTDLASFMALLFVTLALDGFTRFVFLGQTHGGFQAGLTIGIAGLCDPAAIVFAVGFTLAAPLIAHSRFRAERQAGRATAAVLLFPTVAGIVGWMFLCWRFTGSPLGWLRGVAPKLWSGDHSVHALGAVLESTGRPVLLTPLFVIAVVLFGARGRWLPAAGICLPIVCIVVARSIGLVFPGTSVAVVLGIVGVVSLPAKPKARVLAVIVAIALAGIAAKWAYPPSGPVVAWEKALSR